MANINPKYIIGGALALGLVAIVTLMGIAIINNYDEAMRIDDTIAVNGLIPPAGLLTVKTYSAYPYIQGLTGCSNSSDGTAISVNNYTVIEGDRNGGKLRIDDNRFENETWNCTALTYKPDVAGSNSVPVIINGLAVFGLFSAIVALAIVGRYIYQQLQS